MKKLLFSCVLVWIAAPVAAQDSASIHTMIETAVLTGKKDTSAAEKIFQEAIARANAGNHPYLAGKAFYEMGNMYFLHKNHNRSFGSFFNARDLFTKAGAQKEIAWSLFGLGRQQYYRGNYKVAAGHLNYAMREAKTLQLPGLESDALEYLGILYHVMPGTDQQSIAYFKRSFSIKEKLQDRKGMLRMLEKLGAVYYQQKMYDSALFYLNASVTLAAELQLHHDADISRLNRAGAFIRLQRMEEAATDIDRVATQGDTSDLNIAIRYFIQKGNYCIANDKLLDGRTHYNQALAVAGSIGVPEMYGLVYKQMAEAYSCRQMYKEAYEFSQQYNNQMMGYYAENMQILKDLEYIFHTAETKNEVTFLSGENKLKEISLQNERRLRVVLLTGSVVLLLLAAVIFYLYRKQKKKNSIIRKQADDLRTLMKEIHHRVKNNLQIISSLLDLQSVLIKDNQAAQAIKEGRNRVQSMALIHQNLYGEKHIMGIAVDVYINNLAQSLFQSYNIRPGQVALTTDIEKIDLDVETVIPIGLMLNELISNSLKYAFDDSEGGRIEVTLKKSEDTLLLRVKDNGKGFPEPADATHSTSFGMRMIKIFAQKLKADLNIYNDQGACITMYIKKYKLAV